MSQGCQRIHFRAFR